MDKSFEHMEMKQRKLLYLLGEKIYDLTKDGGVRFLYAERVLSEEDNVNKIINLLDYMEARIENCRKNCASDQDENTSEKVITAAAPAEKPVVVEPEAQAVLQASQISYQAEEENASKPSERVEDPITEQVEDKVPDLPADFLSDLCNTARFSSPGEKGLFARYSGLLQNGTEREREMAVSLIVNISDKEALRTAYGYAMDDKSPKVRAAVMMQVARIDRSDFYDSLYRTGLKDDDLSVKMSAIKGIGTHVSPVHFELLSELLLDTSDRVRGLAVTYLGIYFGDEGVRKAKELYSDPHPHVRKSLVKMLAAVKPAGSFGVVQKLLEDSDIDVQSAAKEALSKLLHEKKRRG